MSELSRAIDDWVKQHPYLNEVAGMQKVINRAVAEAPASMSDVPVEDQQWDLVAGELKRGIPALRTAEYNSSLISNTAELLMRVTAALAAAGDLPAKLAEQCKAVNDALHAHPRLAGQVVEQVIKNNELLPDQPSLDGTSKGLLIFLSWVSLASTLEPLKAKVKELQKGWRWRKGYCPVCGHLPAMAQLVRTKRGRERELVCSCCKMRWSYQRIGCPYCGNDDQKTLKIIEFAEIPDLRLDTCEKCKVYIKTYTDQGNEQIALADWSTLHLDYIGKEHGYKRIDSCFYGV